MVSNEENTRILTAFFDNPNENEIILTLVGSQFRIYKSYEPSIKQKYTHFSRTKPEVVTADNFRSVLTFAEMSGKPLDDFSILLEHFFMPLLNCHGNQKGWPQSVKKDVSEHLDEFKNRVDEIQGAIRGETFLPIPNCASKIHEIIQNFDNPVERVRNLHSKSEIENYVIKWTNICKQVLKENSRMAFADGANPTPMEEVEFWLRRSKNLRNIYDQLNDPRIKKLAEFLTLTESHYDKMFKTLFKEIVASVNEAENINKFLQPLIPHIKKFEENDFLDMKDHIKPLIHVIALIWINSKYYSTNEKIVTLFKLFSNLLIQSVEKSLDASSIFFGDPEEILEKINKTIDMLQLFMDSFEYARQNLENFAPEEIVAVQPWNFHRRNVFQRLIDFQERLKLIAEILTVNIIYMKLDRIEIGGLKGKNLTLQCEQIFSDFTRIYQVFQNINYDVLNLKDEKNFRADCENFHEECTDIDKRLATIFSQSFEDCNNVESEIKLIHIFENLSERPPVNDEITKNLPKLLDEMHENIDVVKIIYDSAEKKGILIDNYFPPVAAKVNWYRKMHERVSAPFNQIKIIENDFIQNPSEEVKYIFGKHEEMLQILTSKTARILQEWFERIPAEIEQSLDQFQLVRDKTGKLVHLNIDPRLEAILREIRYLQQLGIEELPAEALLIFENLDPIRESYALLLRIQQYYNFLKEKTLPVEYSIIQSDLDNIDSMLEPLEDTVTWRGNDADILKNMCSIVKHLHDRVREAQKNVETLFANFDSWCQQPLYERKEGKKENLLNTEERDERVRVRIDSIAKTEDEIKLVLYHNYHLYFDIPYTSPPSPAPESDAEPIDPALDGESAMQVQSSSSTTSSEVAMGPRGTIKSVITQGDSLRRLRKSVQASSLKLTKFLKDEKEKQRLKEEEGSSIESITQPPNKEISEKWEAYLEYFDEEIRKRLINAVQVSQQYFLNEMEDVEPITPFLEIQMELNEPDITFDPSVDPDFSPNFFTLIEHMLLEMYKMGKYMERISPLSKEENYFSDLIHDIDSLEQFRRINSIMLGAMEEAAAYVDYFDVYTSLWTNNKVEFLQEFLKYSRALTADEKQQLRDEEAELTFKESPPSLELFKENIDLYDQLYNEVYKLPTEHVLSGRKWLRLVTRPLRQSILNIIGHWGNLFKNHLYNRVIDDLNQLDSFIVEAIKVMTTPLEPEDLEGLLKVMKYLFKIKEMIVETDAMFEPLKEIMELLQTYNVEFPEEVHVQLQEIPDRWMNCKKVAASAKVMVSPLQAAQINSIRKRINLFDMRVALYRKQFHNETFYDMACKDVYKRIDRNYSYIKNFEIEEKQLVEDGLMFDIEVDEFKGIKLCKKELKQVKQLWDYINMMNSCINEWKRTAWSKIDVENMELSCKRFAKDLRAMDKDVRNWNVFNQGEASIKNLLTSLRAVVELQNPAIRDRHWKQLMQATKVAFVMNEYTTLSDLLALNLHQYEEEVKNIVDKSVKEMSMEKTLKELDATWTNMTFGVETHPRTNVDLIQVTEELIETLEDNQSALQMMMSSKFIDHFLGQVTEWQIKLSNADQVISVFLEVQRKWMYLESIFIGSEDIRLQLPEDSKRFDHIDKEFREILSGIRRNLNVIQATNQPGLYDKLENLAEQLTMCEKALNNYLETKRLAFPRFYFVSAADLLDILSNGNQPELIQRHLTKLFDSLAHLQFEGNSKRAHTMKSKENDEYVKLIVPLECTGKVEVWLNKLIDIMRRTLRATLDAALLAYEEKPREAWVFDYPAQPALTGTQIWWTTEVNIAFARLEEGYENAVRDYQKKQILQLNSLINLLLGDLSAGDRQKIMTICTIDVHSRDVVQKLIVVKAESAQAFQWQSQLRHRWDTKFRDCFANICDAQFRYQYEYLGNTPRLVITPLTDRCYITLTQSLHLIMGGAPAGPAGTGKTETTKDLGKALGMMVYVFNCSEQMDYKSIGNIYKGLAQTGCWGCFDEFNRISIEVLSVVAVQVKTIQDAIKENRRKFKFLGTKIQLIHTIGIFITMNPGYAGRTELPENLKALFRPCAMVVPDFELICEIMLVAEGFLEARLLAKKFITLYTLCRELLSKQDHYDWGLRAIKSVLVVAGSLKRGDRLRPEDQVLMRALRDFNIPKIITEDVPIFMGLIGDLFPALDVPRKRDFAFEESIKTAALNSFLQPEDGFTLKIVQLEELLAVRHSVFIVGNAGTGKSCVWKTLYHTYQVQKRRPFYNDLNPKAVTNDELFGVINPSTREWKDGLFSTIMRDQTNLMGEGPKWIVLDGDIDPMWIESLNTLMDDNKVLTLASNERIALTKHMRLLFEISGLKTATPATVSRAGILYINPTDLGWNPYVASWLDKRETPSEKTNLSIMFDRYVPSCLEMMKGKFKKITPICDIAHVQMLCFLLDCFLKPPNIQADSTIDTYETYFVFAVIWAFGSAMFQDQLVDWRNEFSRWFLNEFKVVKFPATGSVFSYYIDEETKKFVPWDDLIQKFDFDPDIPLQSTLVETSETTRIKYFMNQLTPMRIPVMLVGPPGSGKSVLLNSMIESLSDNYLVTKIPFNFYTTSEMLQRILEKPLEKKAGRAFAPPSGKNMIYFIDDMNMPEVDKYFTVQPHTLIKQFMDYQHWYDRQKLSLKDIHNVQFISSMNPTAGSFTIDPRLQRNFCVFAVSFPSMEAASHIYHNILSQHLRHPIHKFPNDVMKFSEQIVHVALSLHAKIMQTFLPTAIKFHYVFNLRDVSNIFQGLLFSTGESVKTQCDLVRLWLHETNRVYGDKMVDESDLESFRKFLKDVVRQNIEISEEEIFEEPLTYCHFAKGLGDPKYFPIESLKSLNDILHEALNSYNDLISAMNLVLFENAMYHICRINRILEFPRGNALLVGVGGSGKQSLTRLAGFISSFECFQIQLTKTYSINDMKADLALLYMKSGLRSAGVVFLMTDAQVPKEEFLVLINDMLSNGEINDLFPDEDLENIYGAVKTEVRGLGLRDTKENCWKFFINRVRTLLKCVLCFSPVGATLRIRARKFPAIVNCVSIDWFHEWPEEALLSVSSRFLSEIPELPEYLVDSVSKFMSNAHQKVNVVSEIYLANEKCYNYTTPKSFLEMISLYAKQIGEQNSKLETNIERLLSGLVKLDSTREEVDGLKETLALQEVEVNKKNEAASKLISVLTAENEKVAADQAIATEEEAKVSAIQETVLAQQKVCADDLAKAEPALNAAKEALNTLNKNNLTELKSFVTPPPAVERVCAAVLVLFSKGKIPKDRSWKMCKAVMGNADHFLQNLINYDKDNIQADVVKVIYEYLNHAEFNPEIIRSKSAAAAGLCSWVINIIKYHEVYVVVEPKRQALAKANKELSDAQAKLAVLNQKLNQLEMALSELRAEFDLAITAKMKCQAEADSTALMVDLANRLINGLGSEKVRWKELSEDYKRQIATLPGDVLLISSFISYVGCFTRSYREMLVNEYWLPYLMNLKVKIPRSEKLDPLLLLTNDAMIAQWNNDGLPTDRMSAENACILLNSARWPLMIDPQLQGINWIKTMYGDSLTILRVTMRNYLDILENCIREGKTVLLENIGENLDSVLDPILGRILIKKGKAIKVGDKEIDYDPNFRLILHTKLANPHYKPEIQAQTTLINFMVTRDGLEEQFLATVVNAERPDLEELKSNLTKQENLFKITLKQCEDNLLYKLSTATGNILGDVELVENLETTKKTANEIQVKVKEAKVTTQKIDEARELYRSCAVRTALIYFVLNDLNKMNALYQFSLKAFNVVFKDAIQKAEKTEIVAERVLNLLDSITYQVYMYTSRGLFEHDKLIFLTHMTFQVLLFSNEIDADDLDFLLRFPIMQGVVSPVDFLNNQSWGGVKALSQLDDLKNFDKNIEGAAKRWKKFVDCEKPEREKYPGEWKNKKDILKLCMMRALRPDRVIHSIRVYIEEKFGVKYVTARNKDFENSYKEMSNSTPIFFILSPGVNPLKDVELLGKKLGFNFHKGNFHSISLGQGQEQFAENSLDLAAESGHWVILENIHLVSKWLPTLEKKIEQTSEKSHENFRLFLSAEPLADPMACVIPQGILQACIKITNEPPTGMLANLHKALDNFNQETLEKCSKDFEFKAFLFTLCYFHAVVAERRKFGPQGWNRNYPFNIGDLTISVNVLYNYLENNSKVPYDDLRYLFGEIMYGGHITDDWDRRLCRTYLEVFLRPELLEGELEYAPGFLAPPNSDYEGYHRYIDDNLPPEGPYLYGLHPNAEINFLNQYAEEMFKIIFELQPRGSASAAGGAASVSKVRGTLEDIQDKIPEPFPIQDMLAKLEDQSPFSIVAIQECERMNVLSMEMRRSLNELDLGLKGELTITLDMELLQQQLFMDQVPEIWSRKAYPSLLPLAAWIVDFSERIKELETWISDFILPPSVWLGGFFNPQSFLTAIMQQTARRNEWPLDKMCLLTDVTKKQKEDFAVAPRDGAYVHGLFMEGASWEIAQNSIVDARIKELYPVMPVIYIKAITQDKQDTRNMYDCPVYKTKLRGPTFVWTFNLKTKEKPSKWTLAGVALLLQI